MDKPPRFWGSKISPKDLEELMNKIREEREILEKRQDYLLDLFLSLEYCKFLIEDRDYWKEKANE